MNRKETSESLVKVTAAEARASFDLVGKRDDGVSPALMAVTTAVGVGLHAMTTNGPSIGGAIGTAVSGLVAYGIVEAIDANLAGAMLIGPLVGTAGVLVATEIDQRLSPTSTSDSELALLFKL
ncbi:hypothetical protein [Pseudomonas sp. BNK-15]|uniref:hypothetical protein n=1 Tax=Pseudomonas sp. BNK-15 TaxID=3376152 RepID=UPI0039BF99EF